MKTVDWDVYLTIGNQKQRWKNLSWKEANKKIRELQSQPKAMIEIWPSKKD